MAKFKNKYRIESNRLQGWDYGSKASYFITICCKDRYSYFGDVQDGAMILSDVGMIVCDEWIKTFDIRPNMKLHMGEYVVMPNHFHAVVGIGDDVGGVDAGLRDALQCVSTTSTSASSPNDDNPTTPYKNKFGPQSNNMASIVRGFKGSVTRRARITIPEFGWQSNYHDHIIRNEIEYQRISKYIINNPKNWADDSLRKL